MFKQKLHVALTAAALLALAACGSGTDSASSTTDPATKAVSGTNASSAPAATRKDNAVIQNAVETGNPTAIAETASNDEGAGALAASAETAATPPINNDYVRGDVLLTMLAQRTCTPVALSDKAIDGIGLPKAQQEEYPEILADLALATSNYSPSGKPQHTWKNGNTTINFPPGPKYTECFSTFYQSYVAPKSGENVLREVSYVDYHQNTNKKAPKAFNYWEGKVPIQYDENGFSIGRELQGIVNVDRGEEGNPKTNTGPDEQATLTSNTSFSAQRTSAVPYGVLQQWRDAAGRSNRLMLVKGNTGQAKLCWNNNMTGVKRLHCTVFSAEQNWTYGDPLYVHDHYLIEDRTPYGETGLINFTYHGAVIPAQN